MFSNRETSKTAVGGVVKIVAGWNKSGEIDDRYLKFESFIGPIDLPKLQSPKAFPLDFNGGMVPVIWLFWTRNQVSFVMPSIPSGRFANELVIV